MFSIFFYESAAVLNKRSENIAMFLWCSRFHRVLGLGEPYSRIIYQSCRTRNKRLTGIPKYARFYLYFYMDPAGLALRAARPSRWQTFHRFGSPFLGPLGFNGTHRCDGARHPQSPVGVSKPAWRPASQTAPHEILLKFL